jgi:hypothetical protein
MTNLIMALLQRCQLGPQRRIFPLQFRKLFRFDFQGTRPPQMPSLGNVLVIAADHPATNYYFTQAHDNGGPKAHDNALTGTPPMTFQSLRDLLFSTLMTLQINL